MRTSSTGRGAGRRSVILSGTILLAAALGLGLPAPAGAQGQTAPPAARVSTVVVKLEPINPAQEFVGRIEAMERVDVRARVTGFLDKVLFKEGDIVQAGAQLYAIERAPFEAAVRQAEGALVKAEGQATNATEQLQRAEQLLKTQAGSAASRDQRRADEQTARGDVLQAEANLATARINLGYTTITAPITGMIGRTKVTKGNVVGPDSGILTSIVSQDPMYVTAPVSQREFLALKGEERRNAGDGLTVTLRFSDGTTYALPGKINFVDVSVDRATDAVNVRASVANPNGQLIDGQLVRVSVTQKTPIEKVLVPQAALIADQQGTYVFVVQDGKAAVRRLNISGELGGSVILESGLNPGDQVIVEGMETLRPGAPVLATPAAAALRRS